MLCAPHAEIRVTLPRAARSKAIRRRSYRKDTEKPTGTGSKTGLTPRLEMNQHLHRVPAVHGQLKRPVHLFKGNVVGDELPG